MFLKNSIIEVESNPSSDHVFATCVSHFALIRLFFWAHVTYLRIIKIVLLLFCEYWRATLGPITAALRTPMHVE